MAKRMGDTNCWIRTFEVTEPTRHRKGFTVYKVTSVVFNRAFPESATKITVWKRYSDFHKLHKELEQIFKQLYLKGEFPVFPKAKLFGRFEHEVVEERRKAALTLLEFTANFTQLFTSKPFMQFFESGYNSQDFIGKILFRKGDERAEDPPVTVLQEKSDIHAPCLKPEILWNDVEECPTNDGDAVSLSPSSVSSSISPTESAETPNKTSNENNPCSSSVTSLSNVVTNPTNGESSKESTAAATTTTNNGISKGVIAEASPLSHVRSQPPSSQDSETCASASQRPNGIVRSATVTDDFRSYFDDEFEDAAFLFPTGSCSSLDTLPGFTASSDVVDSAQKNVPSSSRGLFTLSRKKSNGFGLFDFLPLFPKKSKKKSVNKEKEEKKELEPTEEIKKTSLSVGYICEAAGHFAVAQFHESNAEYENAFAAYKEGIRVLLAGAQDDGDRDRKLLAKNKLEKYLVRAESLKENFLSPGTSKCGTISPVFSSPSKKEKSLSSLTRHGKNACSLNGRSLLCNIEELKPYKVIGVGPGKCKILIVMNPEETSPKCYATKVLWKSSSIIYPEKPTVIPCYVPFMVKLLKWFDSPDKIILLLEHAGGGRLEEFIKNYQSKRLSLSTPPEECSPVDAIRTMTAEATHSEETNKTYCNETSQSNVEATENDDLAFETEIEEPLNATLAENEIVSENEIFSTPAVSPTGNEDLNSSTDTLDVTRLLENSKALLQTVSKTLEEGSSPRQKPPSISNCKNEIRKVLKSTENITHPSTKFSVTSCDMQQVFDEPKRKDSNGIIGLNSRKSSDTSDDFDDYSPLRMVPEGVVRVWAAETLLALEALHGMGITYGDLHINDILLGENGHILLRYKSLWTEVDDKMTWNSYSAPEVRDSVGTPLWKMHPSSDWWSFGAILFLLLTGQTLHSAHPEGIYPDMIVKVPEVSVCETPISKSAQTLLTELLQYSPEIRLGYYGAAEIKTHPFFNGFDWERALEDCRNDEEIIVFQTQPIT